ncbi:sarcosine oxidase subunit gamma [Tranquillimonas alkanivorans]|uniref:Sarcosine oxidase subunit gamma n=1 Tax=Tranquillimonas alkanivorans TaxID=441119 RepID=A0A1I5NQR3_9RHOB|nr:sarcosine oxidase subunit gamma family protein [Tranquillimonas alkanivorans]SFP24145.1 sarcosine oxidase subunit gamma [Tranquillimonas alkanivorans]
MSEPVSALRGESYDGHIRVEEAGLRGMITVRGDLSSEAVARAVGEVSGVEVPGPNAANASDARGLCWMSPDELLLLVPHAEAGETLRRLSDALAGEHALVVDVSDARATFRLTGAPVREVLAKLTPADVSPGVFELGAFRRTRLAQVPAAIWMRDAQTAEVVCFRSVARYMFDLLATAARPGGEVGYF